MCVWQESDAGYHHGNSQLEVDNGLIQCQDVGLQYPKVGTGSIGGASLMRRLGYRAIPLIRRYKSNEDSHRMKE